jgi:aerobic carbon-monoxide dehydrogenase medium subunit
MRIRPFEYSVAASLTDALAQMRLYGSEAKVLAGGTDLVLGMKKKVALPRRVISLHRLRELDFVRDENATIRIGALARHADLAAHPIIRRDFPILGDAVGLIGSWQIRNVGTIGGNLCNASPAADAAPPLLALNASVVLADADGEEEVPLKAFFTGPGTCVLRPDQLLKEIVIDRPRARAAGSYLKLRRRRAVDVSLVAVVFHAELDPGGRKLNRVAVALGGVAPTPIRVPQAEATLLGLTRAEAGRALADCAGEAVEAMRPISDVRATADYRRAVVGAYVTKAGRAALDQLFDGGDAA